MSSADDGAADVAGDAAAIPSKTLPHIDLPPSNAKDRRNSASRLDLKSLPKQDPASPPQDAASPSDRSPSARGRAPGKTKRDLAGLGCGFSASLNARCRGRRCSGSASQGLALRWHAEACCPVFPQRIIVTLCASQAIQSWSEEFKVQLAGRGGDEKEEEEEEEGDGADDENQAAEAQALLDFAEAIEHSGEDVLKGMGVDVDALLSAHTVAGVVSGFKNAAQRNELLRVRLRHCATAFL
jgi:hypothetical protein